MSDMKKGARKPKDSPEAGRQIKPELVTSALIAALYALFLIETIWEGSLAALAFSVLLFAIMVLMSYFVDRGKLHKKELFKSLIYVFAGLSALSMIVELLRYLNVPGMAGVYWAAVLGIASAIASVAIIAGLIYLEKDELKRLYVGLGDKKAAGLGVIGLVLCVAAALVGAYFMFGGNAIGQEKFIQIAASAIVFGILAGIVEELWFRGLLLSRILPLLGESQGNIYQAAVFGVFEAVIFYTITGLIAYLPVIFIIGAFTGFYWGRATLKAGSMAAPVLLHVGLYILLLLPIMTGLMS
ncbi:hypothetical protein MCP_0589 [Methanocella paludicola SANAE]|uniref:CAAX prenyl protease 2/Lysostaphin resistance protein A-like domain-containing protein n=1 Tax=Methanocella paludicola (strain DSM 17711 / JCM 13418 / NBRC 101707 / SANAE) TaxID=304371 RepID=D1YW39_METPS|nr:CPBP family glutamic-type intramembrane protease [Methanocella paludicola]BAI60661.1 hypothetical protein MCP_0589 [Methanocella paludicola SANAE]